MLGVFMFDVIVIGAGPSGMMCASECTKSGLKTVLIDKNDRCGRKMLITGNGACNITNTFQNPNDFMRELTFSHKKFLYSTLSRFNARDMKTYFESNGVPLVLEKEIKYFPKSKKAQDLVDVLIKDIKHINLNEEVMAVKEEDGVFFVETDKQQYQTKNLVVATGSKAYPKTGSTGFGYKIAKQFGHSLVPLYPAETHIYIDEIKKDKEQLMGISVQGVTVKTQTYSYTGDLLFTHFGLSGPVIMHVSEFLGKESNPYVLINFNVDIDLSTQERKEKGVLNELSTILPKRLAKVLFKQYESKLCKHLNHHDFKVIDDILHQTRYSVTRVETIERAFVNGGGVNTKEIDPKSFMSKKKQNLYFIGEVIDMHGPIGGFNMTLSMSSGFSAAQHIKKKNQTS
jgi:predicted Rossmann fold flavoprotein